jgi:hypothetical protein
MRLNCVISDELILIFPNPSICWFRTATGFSFAEPPISYSILQSFYPSHWESPFYFTNECIQMSWIVQEI